MSDNWEKFEYSKIKDYLENGDSVFVDITAKWCLTCAVNKKLVLDHKDMIDLFASNNIKMLQADWTSRNKQILDYLKKHNRHGIPFNILYTPENKKGYIFSEILSKSKIRKVLNEIHSIKLQK